MKRENESDGSVMEVCVSFSLPVPDLILGDLDVDILFFSGGSQRTLVHAGRLDIVLDMGSF